MTPGLAPPGRSRNSPGTGRPRGPRPGRGWHRAGQGTGGHGDAWGDGGGGRATGTPGAPRTRTRRDARGCLGTHTRHEDAHGMGPCRARPRPGPCRDARGHAGHGDTQGCVGQGDAGAAVAVPAQAQGGGGLTGCPLAPTAGPGCWASVPFTAIPSRSAQHRPSGLCHRCHARGDHGGGATTRAPWRPPQCSAPRSIPGQTLPRQTAAQPRPPVTLGGDEGVRAAALGDPRPRKLRCGAGMGEGTQRGAGCARLRGACRAGRARKGRARTCGVSQGWARARGSVHGRAGACTGV